MKSIVKRDFSLITNQKIWKMSKKIKESVGKMPNKARSEIIAGLSFSS